jgi:hypothetical protein
MRVPAGDIEALVLDRLRAFFSSRTDIGDALTPLDLEARAFDAALGNAFTLSIGPRGSIHRRGKMIVPAIT